MGRLMTGGAPPGAQRMASYGRAPNSSGPGLAALLRSMGPVQQTGGPQPMQQRRPPVMQTGGPHPFETTPPVMQTGGPHPMETMPPVQQTGGLQPPQQFAPHRSGMTNAGPTIGMAPPPNPAPQPPAAPMQQFQGQPVSSSTAMMLRNLAPFMPAGWGG